MKKEAKESMATFNVELIEENRSWYFSIDSRQHTEYWYKKQCGLLQRNLHSDRTSNAVELHAMTDAKPHLNHQTSIAALKLQPKETTFNPAKIIRENQTIITSLQDLSPIEWRIIFRANHNSRVILSKTKKEKKNRFTYYSILIKVRLKDHREFIEIGEGSVRELKFNQDGLSTRLKKIISNHRRSQPLSFRDKVPVILNSGDGGIMFHELLGHALEADYIYRKESPITVADIGKPIVSDNVTLVTSYGDDIFFGERSSDDEGETSSSPVLVENGVLKQVISDSFYKKKLNLKHSGHSRLEDFTRPPMPRMYALYLKPGSFHPEELIASTKYGVYAGEFGDGKVYFHKNLFYFYIRDAHLIENGKITRPLGSIMVQGNIFEVLNSVAMIADDFRFDKGISYCFKNGQTINVRVGQPTVKINNLYVSPYKGVQ
jgi:predicted Zn-dependent protease